MHDKWMFLPSVVAFAAIFVQFAVAQGKWPTVIRLIIGYFM